MGSEVLIQRDLSRSLKAKNLDIPDMPVTVTVTMDDELQQLARSGKEGFRLQQLVDAANEALDQWIDGFQSSIDSIDKKLPGFGADEVKDKIDELNDVLVKYTKQMEAQVDKAVEKEWKAIIGRNKELSRYKRYLALKVAAVTLVAAGNIMSLIATAGADVLSAVSLVNVAANLAGQFHRECIDLFKQHERLSGMMADLDETVRKDLDGFKDLAKSVAGDISPALGRFLTSTKGAEVELKSLRMKYVQAEKDADDTVKKINATLDKLAKIDKPGTEAKVYEAVQKLEKQVDDLLKEMIFTRKVINESEKDLDEWADALKAWSDRNPVKARLKKLSGMGKDVSTLVSAFEAAYKTAIAIKSLVA
jgi:hypothetical protein